MPRSHSLHLALPGDLAERVPAAAKSDGLTSTAWIQRAIRRDLGIEDDAHPAPAPFPTAVRLMPCPHGNADCYVITPAACDGCKEVKS